MGKLTHRLLRCIPTAWPKTWATSLFLLKITLPVALVVRLLQYVGVIDAVAGWIDPLFRFIGLPGKSAVVFLTSCLLPPYASIAVMNTMVLTIREATILSVMVLICHALPVECAVTHKTGSGFWKFVVLRILMAFAAAFFLQLILPQNTASFGIATGAEVYGGVMDLLEKWIVSSFWLSLTIIGIIFALMVVQRLIEEFNQLENISRPLGPLMRLFGLPRSSSYVWVVGNLLGISYGSAVMIDLLDSGRVTEDETRQVNRHLAMNHSLLEDTTVFASLGINPLVIVLTRVLFALVVVWGGRMLAKMKIMNFRV